MSASFSGQAPECSSLNLNLFGNSEAQTSCGKKVVGAQLASTAQFQETKGGGMHSADLNIRLESPSANLQQSFSRLSMPSTTISAKHG